MDCNVINLFPSPVIQVYVKEDTNELLGHNEYTVSHEQRDDYEKPSGSQRVLEKYPKTKEILLNKFNSVAEEQLGYKKRDWAITTSWFTFSKRGEGSQLHSHRNSFWSCVYYYQEEYGDGSGGISFDNPNINLFEFYFSHHDIIKSNHFNCSAWEFTPEPGLLLIFPSYLQHQIMKHNNDAPRSSLAFNIVPLGKWGDGDSYYDMAWTVPEYINKLVKND